MTDSDDKARAKQLAKDLLDGLDQPKSPEREAYEAQKEREDRAALERFYITTGQAKPEVIVAHAVGELADLIERIDVALTLTGGRKALLRFAPKPSTPETGRYVELR